MYVTCITYIWPHPIFPLPPPFDFSLYYSRVSTFIYIIILTGAYPLGYLISLSSRYTNTNQEVDSMTLEHVIKLNHQVCKVVATTPTSIVCEDRTAYTKTGTIVQRHPVTGRFVSTKWCNFNKRA
jgi:hypothetical protein